MPPLTQSHHPNILCLTQMRSPIPIVPTPITSSPPLFPRHANPEPQDSTSQDPPIQDSYLYGNIPKEGEYSPAKDPATVVLAVLVSVVVVALVVVLWFLWWRERQAKKAERKERRARDVGQGEGVHGGAQASDVGEQGKGDAGTAGGVVPGNGGARVTRILPTVTEAKTTRTRGAPTGHTANNNGTSDVGGGNNPNKSEPGSWPTITASSGSHTTTAVNVKAETQNIDPHCACCNCRGREGIADPKTTPSMNVVSGADGQR